MSVRSPSSGSVAITLGIIGISLASFSLGAAFQQKFGSSDAKTNVPNVRVTEQYTKGQRVTSGKTTAWSTGDGKNWSMAYQSDGIFIDCRN